MLAIIPARGGSKGLPRKNVKLLNGKPLIAYTIEAALLAKGVTRVIVSTDDEEIAKIAVQFGAEVPFMRPEYLASDNSRSIDVYINILEEIQKRENKFYEEFIVLQPTSPLRNSKDIDEAISIFKNQNADSVVSYCLEHHPLNWHKYITDEGKFIDIFDNTLKNRQDEKPTYFPNGAVYIFKSNLIFKGVYYTENSYAFIMERNRSIDIDTIDDFELVEWILKNKK